MSDSCPVQDRPGQTWTELDSMGFLHAIQNGAQLKTCEFFSWNFPCNIFGLWLSAGNKLRKVKLWIGGDACRQQKDEKVSIYEAGRRLSARDAKSASTLILDFPSFGTVRNQFVLFTSHPVDSIMF